MIPQGVDGAGGDAPADAPSEAAAVADAPLVQEQAVQAEQPSSVPSEATSALADDVPETSEVAEDVTPVEDDTAAEAPIEVSVIYSLQRFVRDDLDSTNGRTESF